METEESRDSQGSPKKSPTPNKLKSQIVKSNTIEFNKNKKNLLEKLGNPPVAEIPLRKKKPIDDYVDDLNMEKPSSSNPGTVIESREKNSSAPLVKQSNTIKSTEQAQKMNFSPE